MWDGKRNSLIFFVDIYEGLIPKKNQDHNPR